MKMNKDESTQNTSFVFWEDKLKQNALASYDPRIFFTGYVYDQDELAELYHNCFAYLHASYNGEVTQPSYHSMVLEAFGVKPPKGVKNPVISHKNNKKTDNRLSNLKYASTSDNTQDAYSDGLIDKKGSNNKDWRKENGSDGSKTGKKKD